MIRVFIADDHGVVRAGVRALLASQPTLEVVGEADSVDGVMDFFSRADRDADVLVLDLSLPGRSGSELLREVRALRPEIRVVIYSMYPARTVIAYQFSPFSGTTQAPIQSVLSSIATSIDIPSCLQLELMPHSSSTCSPLRRSVPLTLVFSCSVPSIWPSP